MNLNKISLLGLFLLHSIVSMEHAHRFQEAPLDQNKKQNPKTLVKEYFAYAKSCDTHHLNRVKQEYEKAKGNQLTQIVNKLRSPAEGLLGTTAVKTDNGYRKIAELKVGDIICCYDFTNQRETTSKVTYADKIHLKKHIQIIVNDQIVHVSPSHKFYIPSLNMWVTATDIRNNLNLRQLVDPNIKDVKEVKEALDVVRITVDEKQNYFITDHNILVHNFAIEGAILWGAGEGAVIAWSILKPTLIGLGMAASSYVAHKAISQNRASSGSYNEPPRMIFDWDALQRDLPPEQRHPSWVAKNTDQNKTPQTPKLNDNGGGAPQDPNKDDKDKDPKPTIKINDKNGQDKHIFRNAPGHLSDTPENRKLLTDMVKNITNFLGTDKCGVDWYGKTLSNGKQVWAMVRNNLIRNGGVNETPRIFNPNTGLRIFPGK